MRSCVCAGLLLVIVFGLGCGGSGRKTTPISGTVTLDGQPVPEGSITFFPDPKEYDAEVAQIKDGEYDLRVTPGKKRVEITASRTVPGKKGPYGEDVIEQYIPPQYNAKTTLTPTVNESEKVYDFALESTKKK